MQFRAVSNVTRLNAAPCVADSRDKNACTRHVQPYWNQIVRDVSFALTSDSATVPP
jgi:hypothetical protein